jgi:hypothetical protein
MARTRGDNSFLSGVCTHCVTRVFAIGIWERHVISEIAVVAAIVAAIIPGGVGFFAQSPTGAFHNRPFDAHR